MSTHRLLRLSGAVLVLGGILFAIGNLLHPTTHSPAAYASPLWTEAHVTFMVGMIGILLGLPALYATSAERTGWLGLIGFIAFFAGVAYTLGGSWFEAFGVPELDDAAIHTVEHGVAVPFNIVGALLFLSGQIAFGIALYRARVAPRVACGLMILTGIALLPASGLSGEAAGMTIIATTAILGLSLALLGAALYKSAAGAPALDEAVAPAPASAVA